MKKIFKIAFVIFAAFSCCACSAENIEKEETDGGVLWEDIVFDSEMPLEYAEMFSVSSSKEGYDLIKIENEGSFLVVDENSEIPSDVPEEITVLKRPIENIYIAATSAMDFFSSLDAMASVSLSGTKAEGWYIEKARQAMEEGKISYAGKYSAPDYEQIVESGCSLAVESTMIYHTPVVKENLESFGIPVLVERSSYESHPLGRTEWVKLYGVLLDKEDEAEKLMEEQSKKVKALENEDKTEKSVGFFYVSSRGYVNVRKSGDYVSKMISLAGGKYLFEDLGDKENALSTMNMQMEEFFASAKDADILIYNSTIEGELASVEDLTQKCPLLVHCRAVENGDVWCSSQNMFQETMSLGEMISELSAIIGGKDTSSLKYFYRLK